MAAIIRLVRASSAEPGPRARGQFGGRPLMKIRSCASVIILIGVLRLTTALVYAGDGQDAPASNAMNPRGVNSIVERDPEGSGIGENSRSPSGLLTASAPLVKEPSKTSGGMLYRMMVEFSGTGTGGD